MTNSFCVLYYVCVSVVCVCVCVLVIDVQWFWWIVCGNCKVGHISRFEFVVVVLVSLADAMHMSLHNWPIGFGHGPNDACCVVVCASQL